jgi:branched-chain amino acid transport system substrate-binding protein
VRLDPRSGRVLDRVAVPSRSPGQLAIGAGAVWLTDPFAGGVWRIDAGKDAPPPRIVAVDQGVEGVAAGAGVVWTSNPRTGTVARIDAASGRVLARIGVGGAPRGIALGAGRLWVTVAGGGGTSLAGSLDPGADVAPVDSRNCGPALAGPGGDPDLLVVSDVPLEGSWRPAAEAMNAAVAFVLRERRFRAGRFTVAMQSCNDALAQTGNPDELKCEANATAYARNPAVIGVVGPVHSFCSAIMLPVLNRAAGGPVSIVSTANSFPLLVRPDPIASRELFPSGQRGYARVFPSDDYEAAAGALFAQRLSRAGVFYAEDQFDPVWRRWFRRTARRIGLPILGAATVEVPPGGRGGARRGRMLAERVAASGARVVYLAGLRDTVAALRARLGRGVDLIVAGKYDPVAALFGAAGPAARGAYITIAGLPRDRLGPTGRRFVRDFGATRPGGQVPTLAVYAAAATEVMLDAIARSDGTRESVSRALAAVRLPDGPLGPIVLDRNGEVTRNPIAIVRADRGGEPHDPGGTQGGTVVDVIEPDARLVAE